jgi:hypothetical protein
VSLILLQLGNGIVVQNYTIKVTVTDSPPTFMTPPPGDLVLPMNTGFSFTFTDIENNPVQAIVSDEGG